MRVCAFMLSIQLLCVCVCVNECVCERKRESVCVCIYTIHTVVGGRNICSTYRLLYNTAENSRRCIYMALGGRNMC